MASSVKTYDPKLYALVIGGIPVSGFADGTFFRASRASDTFTKQVGGMGEVTRSHQHDRSGEFAFTLQQTSLYNDVLSAIHRRDEEKNAGVTSIIVKDAAGTTVCSASQAWIRKPPDVELGKDNSNREWILDVGDYEVFIGGSNI